MATDPPVHLLPTVELTNRFAAECGLRGAMRFIVDDHQTGASEKFDIDTPFVVIGRKAGCQIRLSDREIGHRHAYVQVIEGRLYCFALDSRLGVRWPTGLRQEGFLTDDDVLRIGEFGIRLSRAPAFRRSIDADSGNEPLKNEESAHWRMRFANAFGRSSHSPLRALRNHVTLLGRSGRCHLKLSDASVSTVHCAIVRTDNGLWVIDLVGRDGIRVNDREVDFAPLEAGDTLQVGRFRMELHDARASSDSVLAQAAIDAVRTDVPAAAGAGRSERDEVEPGESGLIRVDRRTRPRKEWKAELPARTTAGELPENVMVAMMEQFAQMQQQLLGHAQEQMLLLVQMFGTLQREQHEAVLQQLGRLHEITAELGELRSRQTEPAPALGDVVDASYSQAPAAAKAPAVASEEPPAAESASATESKSGVQVPPPNANAPEPPESPSEPSETAPVSPASQPAPSRGHDRAHEWVTRRIGELERERSGHWKRLMQLISGQN